MKEFVSTVIGGAIGLVALYVVGRVAYKAGKDMGKAESRYYELQRRSNEMEEKLNNGSITGDPEKLEIKSESIPSGEKKSGLFKPVRNLFHNKASIIGSLLSHPEKHRVEAFVDGQELHVNVIPRTA
jgi:hypothetical protein